MADQTPSAAGGALIAFGVIIGVAVGVLLGEPTSGFLGGLALGVAAALLVWWRDRR